MPRISIGDCQLYYERTGGGFPVVFVTGLSGHANFWREQLPVFAKSFEVVAFDHRGIGQSDHSRISYTVERLAADTIGLLDALGIQKAHVIGHSTGGAIAQVLGIEHAPRLASLIICASWPKADAYFRRLFALRKEILAKLGPSSYVQANSLFLYPSYYIAENNEKLRQHEAQDLATFSSAEIMLSRIDAILAFDRTSELGRIRTPTLVVASQDDNVTPAYFSEQLARAIPGAEVKFLPQGGHCFPHTMAREFNHAVLPFLLAHTPAEARRTA
ncbi:MAG: alpha/beta fold hydrolase [Alphaproteobacteria bacterium]|nr:alpha/beta fold hydrolase [Alphaproteobacteria bacterium]